MECKEDELQALYTWVDAIPLSRPKRAIARDFADGVLVAEVVHHYFPKLVELHNYSLAHGLAQKQYNWSTLNQRVFRRLGFVVAKAECEAIALCEPGAIERVLKLVRARIAGYAERQRHTTKVAASTEQDAWQEPSCSKCGAALDAPQPRASEPQADVDVELRHALLELQETRELNEILEAKTRKLEQLLRLKDEKIHALEARLRAAYVT
ncbi:hypothetical protein WJX81_004390 [Elliptochloris bilobata]|uniref:Calponin-homology (CH) domain-containing protein n=1 Tax=Elliptochloris bilobata TaxID=381761 RepID=A0AAW1RWJ3_9CHLO